jgi:hypothetical protein
MFWLLALVLVAVWAGLFFALHITSFFIHVLLLLAVLSLIGQLFSGRKSV